MTAIRSVTQRSLEHTGRVRFLVLAIFTVAVAFALRERSRTRRDDLVPHGLAVPDPEVRPSSDEAILIVAAMPYSEALMAQGLLRSAGIPSALVETASAPSSYLPEMARTMRIEVRASDAAEATAILRSQ